MSDKKPWGKEAVKEAVLTAATELIAEHGFKAISIRDIALAANVNHGLITAYFGSKFELVKEVASRSIARIAQSSLANNATLQEIWLKGFDDYSVDIKTVVRILLDEPDVTIVDKMGDLIGSLVEWVKKEQAKHKLKRSIDPVFLLFAVASLFLGAHLLEPYLKNIIGLTDAAFQKYKQNMIEMLADEYFKFAALPR